MYFNSICTSIVYVLISNREPASLVKWTMLMGFLMHFCSGTMTTHAESINSDLQRVLDRCLRHTTLNTEQNQLAIKVSADN